jgi:hypothetical protein
MTAVQVEKLHAILFKALVKVQEKHKTIIKSDIKYCVVIEPDGKLVTADWLNNHPEIIKDIQEQYDLALMVAQSF